MNNILIKNSENKDLILRTCLNNLKDFLSPNRLTSILAEESNLKSDEYEFLIKEIFKFEIKVADIRITDKKCLICSNSFTEKFLDEGGFTKIQIENDLQYAKILDKENLELDNLKLQKEGAEYLKSIRKKDEEIKNLTTENLILQNTQLKRYIKYSVISFLCGAIITNIKDILNLLKIYFLK